MGYRLESDTVRKIALDLIDTSCEWDFGGTEDISYLKTTMYNAGIRDMMKEVIKAIEELKKS